MKHFMLCNLVQWRYNNLCPNFRAQVNNLLKGDHFASYLVDFGDHIVVSLDKLRVLPQNFCALPYQAVKAKVSGMNFG